MRFRLALPALLLLTAAAPAEDEPGWLARTLTSLLSSETGGVRIGRAGGALPFAGWVEDVRVSDAGGVWLSIERIELDWKLAALLRRTVALNSAVVSGAVVHRLPTAEPSDASTPLVLPDLPVAFDVDRFAVRELALREPAARFAIEGSGRLTRDWSELALTLDARRVDGDGRLQARIAEGRIALDYSEAAGGLVATLADLPERPPLTLTLSAERGDAGWRGSLQGSATGLVSLDVIGEAALDQGLRLSASGTADVSALGDTVRFALAAHRRPDGAVRLVSSHWEARGATVDAEGALLPRIELNARVAAPLPEIDGSAEGTVRIVQREAWHIAGDGTVRSPLLDAVGGRAEWSAALAAQPDRIAIERLALATREGRVTASGDVRLGERIETKLDLTMSGRRWPDPRLAGTLAATLDGARIVRSELTLRSASARLEAQARGPFAAPEGTLRAEATAEGVPMQASAAFALDERLLRLRDVRVRAPFALVQGEAEVARATGLVEGDFRIAAEDLTAASALAGMALAGSASGSFELAARDGIQAGRLDLSAHDLHVGAAVLAAVRLRARGTPADLQFEASGAGMVQQPFSLDFAGRLAQQGETQRLTVSRLAGRVAEIPLALREPLQLARRGERIELAPTRLRFGGGTLALNATLAPNELAARIDIESVPLPLEMGGRLDGAAELEGSRAAPRLAVDLRASGMKPGGADTPPLEARLAARWRDDRLDLSGTVEGFGAEPLRVAAQVPVQYRAEPLAIELRQDAPIGGTLSGPVEVGRALALAGIDEQATGTAQIDLRAGGTVAEPAVEGGARLEGGRYVNLDAGLVLDRIALRASADRQRLILESLTAGDGGNGRLTASGELLFAAALPWRAEARLNGFSLRPENVEAELAGTLSAAGTSDAARLAGTLRVERGELRLPDRLPPSIVKIEFTEINGDPAASPRPVPSAASGLTVTLAVALEAPGRLFVRGRGLDSEWQGSLRVSGTASEPDLEGRLTLVRGRFDFLGRQLQLAEGSIEFPGGRDLDPFINIVATARTDEIEARIALSGRASKPELTLTSVPPLPEDEILARLLFGRSIAQLSALQALQLAQGIRTLTGGGGFDIIARVRDATGLDVIDVKTGEEGGAALSVGKYINDRIFVSVDQGTTPESTKLGVEVEVTDRVTVETDLGGRRGGEVSLNYKVDY